MLSSSRCIKVALHDQRSSLWSFRTRAYAQATVATAKMKKQTTEKKQIVRMKDNPSRYTAMSSNALNRLNRPHYIPTNVSRNTVGTALAFSDGKHAVHKVFGLPRRLLLEFRLLSKPCTVVRDVTVDNTELLDIASNRPSVQTRAVLTGRAGCGKSVVLLQAVEYCKARDWVVIYIPRAVNLVNSTTTHVYDLRTRTYLQPEFSYQLLMRMVNVNSAAFSSITTEAEIDFGRNDVSKLPAGSSLDMLVAMGLKDHTLAPLVLDMVMKELEIQDQHPVLLAVDDFQALYSKTAYRDPHFAIIDPFHLAIPRTILEYASGKRSFRRGAVLAALTSSDANYQIPIELQRQLDLPLSRPSSEYHKQSTTLVDYASGLQNIRVPDKLTIDEAVGVFELWKDGKAVLPSAFDETFMAKYSESSGNARDFVSKGLLASLES